jgi:hypothetical protein
VRAIFFMPPFLRTRPPGSSRKSSAGRRSNGRTRRSCEKHGLPLGTPQHARCAADLMAIRARENERTAAEVRELF